MTTRPRLAYVLRSYPELSETFVVREVEGLLRAGVPITVLSAWQAETAMATAPRGETLSGRGPASSERRVDTSAWARGVASDLLRLAVRPRRAARAARLALFARRAASLLPPDTVRLHAHFASDAAALCRYTAALASLPYRVTAHAYDLYQDPFLLGENLAAAERVYTVSKANEAWLLLRAGKLGFDPARLKVLRCGLDLEAFPFREPGGVRSPVKLVCVARLVPKKGHAVLIDALDVLAERGVEAVVDLIGDGPLAEEVKRRGGRAKLLGAMPPEAARDKVREADLAVLASRVAEDGDRDGLPVTLVEAAALGVPIVATAVAGIPELVTGETGWLSPPDDPRALAATLHEAITAAGEVRIAKARAARGVVEREFDVMRQVEELGT